MSSVDHGCKWVIEKIVPKRVKIHDLGIPDIKGRYPIYVLELTKEDETRIYNLHEHFTWNQLCNSQGLRNAEANGLIRTIEKIPPTPITINTTTDNSALVGEISELKSLVAALIQNQAQAPQQPVLTPELLKALASGKMPDEAGSSDAAALAAVKAFEKTGGNIESNLDLSGNRTSVKSDAADIADSLSQMNFTDEEDDE